MVPDHALRFRSMLRAMNEVVIPALDASQRLALDQAQIVAGNLRILIDQAGYCSDYQRVELTEWRELGAALLQLQGEAGDCATAVRGALAETPAASESDSAEQLLRRKQSVDALLRQLLDSSQPSIRQRAGQLVLQQAASQLTRERVWFAGAGFELDRDALPAMDAVLKR